MQNCIYEDGTVLPIDSAAVCPVVNDNGAGLVDAVEESTTVDVITAPPVDSRVVLILIAVALLAWTARR